MTILTTNTFTILPILLGTLPGPTSTSTSTLLPIVSICLHLLSLLDYIGLLDSLFGDTHHLSPHDWHDLIAHVYVV